MSDPISDHASSNGSQPAHSLPGSGVASLAGVSEIARTRPEVVVGAAFAGGLALAIFIRRLVRSA